MSEKKNAAIMVNLCSMYVPTGLDGKKDGHRDVIKAIELANKAGGNSMERHAIRRGELIHTKRTGIGRVHTILKGKRCTDTHPEGR